MPDLWGEEPITRFRGEYGFLSNFHLCPVEYRGKVFPSSENAYQWAKSKYIIALIDLTPDFIPEYQRLLDRYMLNCTPGESKRQMKEAILDPLFHEEKDAIMHDVVTAKFGQNPDLRKLLIDTGDAALIEGNDWGDKYWGQVDGVGKNRLGMILMNVRRIQR